MKTLIKSKSQLLKILKDNMYKNITLHYNCPNCHNSEATEEIYVYGYVIGSLIQNDHISLLKSCESCEVDTAHLYTSNITAIETAKEPPSLETLTQLMLKHNITIRTIPQKIKHVYELHYAKHFPQAEITYMEEFKREMLVYYTIPENPGKFIYEQVSNTDSLVSFRSRGKRQYFDTLEELIEDVERRYEID